ncbi:MAG TPA: hypothetical protein VFC54_10100, partial [Pseudolabrys sp.]|nr:hypothetical protein [Pseudolabrys sp.]
MNLTAKVASLQRKLAQIPPEFLLDLGRDFRMRLANERCGGDIERSVRVQTRSMFLSRTVVTPQGSPPLT